MICLAVTFQVRPGAEDRAADSFRKLTEHSRAEPGCLMYQFHRSPTDPRKFFVYEQYVDEAALQSHSNSAYFARYVHQELSSLIESSDLVKYEPI
ncbi:putative quinol monooxygenase [Paludisphaera mucosa]|uniref:Quinol monooxygenase n=1 Tax=Paludisphaera mucosa TaxID=3030827 RepID=A0ABT6FBQ7_9BACT|nr:putative quinol monooxygenase [Paludisphaera mucosa]MDG3005011.1 putative quinol monooxygenase [Paludisphaera mucosa]